MLAFRSVVSLLSKKQLILVLVIVVGASVGFVGYTLASNPVPAKKASGVSSLAVAKSQPSKLSQTTLTSDNTPSSVTSNLQSQPSSPGEASSQPLQTDVNINDPSLANNTLVQSVLNSTNP
ncbi:MAG TPA: hypothetical protein VGF75_04115 [Candidatus Saccharimonadales bacterium]|jgi:hypothetical protein